MEYEDPKKSTKKKKKPHRSNVEGNKFRQIPPAIKDKALKRIACGESAYRVAKDMGLASSTVARWQKDAGVEKGSALKPEANPMIVQPDEIMGTFAQEVRNQNVDAALNMFLQMQDGVEDKYRVLMAQQLYNVFHKVMQNPPPIRNWGDVERAHKIMNQILNPGGKNGGAAKIQIQFEAIKEKPQTIEAELVEEDQYYDPTTEDQGSRD